MVGQAYSQVATSENNVINLLSRNENANLGRPLTNVNNPFGSAQTNATNVNLVPQHTILFQSHDNMLLGGFIAQPNLPWALFRLNTNAEIEGRVSMPP